MKITSLAKQTLRVQIGTPQWVDSEIRQYLLTGEYDSFFAGWPGSNHFDAAAQGMQQLRTALLVETMRRSNGLQFATGVPDDLYAWSSNKLRPMVHGLFGAKERAAVLHLLASNIVFLTPANVAAVLQSERWLSTAWDVANIYLESLAVSTLSAQARNIVGLSQDARCYVSMAYFQETDPFADFVVHEAAHVFHNCRRSTAGLRERSRSDYLLDVDYCMRETFAWACEAWSRITSTARSSSEREVLLKQHAEHGLPADDRVDHDEYLDILLEATKARSGWQKILSRCAARR